LALSPIPKFSVSVQSCQFSDTDESASYCNLTALIFKLELTVLIALNNSIMETLGDVILIISIATFVKSTFN
jgi:hypothetical protein